MNNLKKSNCIDSKLDVIATNLFTILSKSDMFPLSPSGMLEFKQILIKSMKEELESNNMVEVQVSGDIACEIITKAASKMGIRYPKINGSYEAVLFSSGATFFNNRTSIELNG